MNNDLTRFKIKDATLTAFEGPLVDVDGYTAPVGCISLSVDGLRYILEYSFYPELDSNEDGPFTKIEGVTRAKLFVQYIEAAGVVDLTKWRPALPYLARG